MKIKITHQSSILMPNPNLPCLGAGPNGNSRLVGAWEEEYGGHGPLPNIQYNICHMRFGPFTLLHYSHLGHTTQLALTPRCP